MVKGITRRVIIIKSPDPNIFDEAIFFVKDEPFNKGVSRQEVLRQARNVAEDYLTSHSGRKIKFRLTPLFYAAMGGLLASAIWLLSIIIF